MTPRTAPTLQRPPSAILIKVGVGALLGVAIALLPPDVIIVVGGALFFSLLALITPWAPLIALLILAPLRALIATESALTLPLDIGQLLFLTLSFIWIAHSIARDRVLPRLRWTPFYLPLAGFIIITGLTAFTAQSITSWLSEWLKWIQIGVMVALCLDLATRRTWPRLIFALTIAGIGNAIIGIYQYFGGSGALHLLINDVNFRAFGTFGQPNPFGAFMGITGLIALAAALGFALRALAVFRHDRKLDGPALLLSLIHALGASVIVVALLFSYSRGAWLGFGLATASLIVLAPRRLSHGLIIILLVGGLAIGLWLSGRLPASITERIRSATEETFATNDVRGINITPENYALVERVAHWQAAVAMATAHPWLGVGFGGYEEAYPNFRLINWEFPLGHAHNYYLNVLAETGMIGLATYIVLWLFYLWLALRVRRHPDPLIRLTAAGLFAIGVYVTVHSLTDNVYVNNLFLHLGAIMGLLSVLHYQIEMREIVKLS